MILERVNLTNEVVEEQKRRQQAQQFKKRSLDYSRIVRNIHPPKQSEDLKLELEKLKDHIHYKPKNRLEKPIDYLSMGRNK